MLTFDDIKGKTILVGVNYRSKSRKLVGRKQYSGEIIYANVAGIRIRCKNGKEITIPPRLEAIFPAKKGRYGIVSTGEVTINPDYITVWDVELQDG